MAYAATTSVSVEKSRAEIETILKRYGANKFAYYSDEQGAAIIFEAQGRRVKFVLPLPNPRSEEFTRSPSRRNWRTPEQAQAAWEQGCRSRWRGLCLIIKAKLEAVEAGILTFEDEFLAHTMLPSGETFAQWAGPRIDDILNGYDHQLPAGTMPELMPGAPT